jgi:hypothetical protein
MQKQYEPTPEEILLACAEIRQDWSDEMYRKRAGEIETQRDPTGPEVRRFRWASRGRLKRVYEEV